MARTCPSPAGLARPELGVFRIEPGMGVRLSFCVLLLREEFAARLRRLAAQGVLLGTSSWKYPGWFDTIYDRSRYVWRGRFSEARFERNCLAEYAEVFPTVSVDATYYKFPTVEFLAGLAAQVPASFQFAFKVTDEITLKHWPHVPRSGARAGLVNPRFLDAGLFTDAFLGPLEAIRTKVGLVMLEFSRFSPQDFARGADFAVALDAFLERVPRGWPLGIELRNRQWLQPEYFSVLARHGVTHIYNAWADMPLVGEQMALPGSEPNPSLLAARFLLREGRRYEEAVKQFSPYRELQEANPEGRVSASKLIRRGQQSGGKTKVSLFVNNRYEGHAPGTIKAVLDAVEAAEGQ
jgi:uncharacterized protein YecE (DUF72 family)